MLNRSIKVFKLLNRTRATKIFRRYSNPSFVELSCIYILFERNVILINIIQGIEHNQIATI